jgi:hypothetical protein
MRRSQPWGQAPVGGRGQTGAPEWCFHAMAIVRVTGVNSEAAGVA